MQHPKALLASVVLVAIIVAGAYYYLSIKDRVANDSGLSTEALSPEQTDALLESLKAPEYSNPDDAVITPEQSTSLDALMAEDSAGDGTVNHSLLDSLKAQ